MSEKKIPAIRFKGFTDDWEQRKLGKVIESYSGGTPSVGVREYYGGNIPFIRSAEINSKSTEFFITNSGLNNSSARLVSQGDILYALYGATSGEVGRAKISGAINQAILAIKPNVGYDAEYITQWLRKNKQNITDTYLQGGQGNLSGTIVKEFSVHFPAYSEQQKIGRCFCNIDNLLALHHRKLTNLQLLKKSILTKMFPKNSNRVPEIRFQGFHDNWQTCKLGDISAFITKGATPTTYGFNWVDYGIPFFRNDSIKDNIFVYGDYSYISEEANDALSRSEITGKDILIAITGDIGKVAIVPDNIKRANINQHIARVRIQKIAVPYFVYQYMITDKIQRNYQKIKTGLSMPQLSLDQIRNTKIELPSYEEQSLISQYLYGIDNTIFVHQIKLDKLQKIKQAMLSKLFV